MSSVPGPQAFTAAHRYAHPHSPPNVTLTPPSPSRDASAIPIPNRAPIPLSSMTSIHRASTPPRSHLTPPSLPASPPSLPPPPSNRAIPAVSDDETRALPGLLLRVSARHNRLYVKSLYRRYLNNSLNWYIRRDLWRQKAIEIRAEFERNRCVLEVGMRRKSWRMSPEAVAEGRSSVLRAAAR